MPRNSVKVSSLALAATLGVALGANVVNSTARAAGNTNASPAQASNFKNRGDIRHLPDALKDRLEVLANRPTTFAPMTAFSEAPTPSKLFQHYLLDTKHFQPKRVHHHHSRHQRRGRAERHRT
jgi:hypothetical protein